MDTDQLEMPLVIDQSALTAFLDKYLALEDEQDRLREELRLLCEAHKERLPLRGIRTAIKVVRAKHKLEMHTKEPMSLVHQAVLEHMVEMHLSGLQAALDQLTREVAGMYTTLSVPDMTGNDGA